VSSPLTREQVESYRRDGHLLYGTLFGGAALDELRRGIDRCLTEHGGNGRSEHLLNLHVRDEWLLALALDGHIADLVEGLIGPDIALLNTRILRKPPADGYAVPWHQDAGYFPLEPLECVSLWLAVDDATAENGALRVLPGRHREGLLEHVPVSREGNVFAEGIPADLIDERKAVMLTLTAGSCSFHDVFLPHGSGPNLSSGPRCAFIARYFPTSARLVRDRRALYGEDYGLYLVRGAAGLNRYANSSTPWSSGHGRGGLRSGSYSGRVSMDVARLQDGRQLGARNS
jgi:phytanoyl-CoA hydroxylase